MLSPNLVLVHGLACIKVLYLFLLMWVSASSVECIAEAA